MMKGCFQKAMWRADQDDDGAGSAGRILTVDDDHIVLYGLGVLLRNNGFEVGQCEDGVQALDAVGREHWDLMILDLGLPSPVPKRVARFDGIKVLEWMTRLHRDIPVLVFTGCRESGLAEEAVAAGAVGIVRKSDPVDRLLQEVRLALAHKQAAAANCIRVTSFASLRPAHGCLSVESALPCGV